MLEGLEKVSQQTQGEIGILKLKFESNEERTKNLQILVNGHDQELQDINEDLDGIEDVMETVDNNIRKNNLKLRGLHEDAEGENLVDSSSDLFTAWLGARMIYIWLAL